MTDLSVFALRRYKMRLLQRQYPQSYLMLCALIFTLMCPYSIWTRIYSGFDEWVKLSNIEALLKSSTLYVIIKKCLLQHPTSNGSVVQCLGADTCSEDASRFGYMHTLIRSHQERIGMQVKFPRIDAAESKSRFISLHLTQKVSKKRQK